MHWLVTGKGLEANCDLARLKAALRAKRGPLWLDIQEPKAAAYDLLESGFGIHKLTIEDIQHGGQRPKWEDYPGYVFLVLIALEWSEQKVVLREQYLCISPSWIVSIHQESNPALAQVRRRLGVDASLTQGSSMFLTYLVTEAIVDSAFPALDAIDEEVDALEDRLVTTADQSDLARITELKHTITDLRRILGAQRDSFQRLVTQSIDPNDADASLYFRDVYDHLVRQYETVDSLRDLLSGAMDTYLSTVSNRLNGTMKTLTVMASLFLPLTFLTGFFGMNFGYLTGIVQPSGAAFAGGIVLMVGSLVIQLFLFRRRHWI
ncbi:MAG TPA: magnesium transporter CorA family protein [Candidatus Dormibacteraeota bacterium]|nr:magnesium transporter CorA family protein [Candidatus Dormibacteraeota bacterium]